MGTALKIVATLVARQGSESQLRDLLLPAVRKFRDEPGCGGYVLLEDKKHPGRFVTYETWTDETALAAHMTSPTMVDAAPKLMPLLDGGMRQDFLTVLVELD